MVRRAQMQKQMGGISSTKADKLLKKAKKMNIGGEVLCHVW